MPLTHVAVSMSDHLSYREPVWRLLEKCVAMATASRERCYLVFGVTPLMEGSRDCPKMGMGESRRGLKLESVSPESPVTPRPRPSTTWPDGVCLCVKTLAVSLMYICKHFDKLSGYVFVFTLADSCFSLFLRVLLNIY